ncbi:DNA-binding transcriptional LysR family regulator [Evansella vedderi]|uniref:DNA-binding transcriptional LysR family regulator n=1 Tax=Evansella vedderi TaxID=38282 RepID=A0ABT9ZQM6_9BACI|nr:LysR family transcriptional regulator [Evansella vedderi]MDQ0253032.1 DNA-binding transcriptional LysR family regulator [Evansella vedderi]
MNLLSLRYFLEVANSLNFSQAARDLHISQPGLSQQITLLEQNLGFKLLNRTTRKVSLTIEGEYLYKHLMPSFENIERTLKVLVEKGAIPQSTIKIATVPSAASNWIPNLLNQLKETFENIEFYIEETSSKHAIELVKEKECDIALIRTPIEVRQLVDHQLKITELTRHPLKVVVPVNHPLSTSDSVDLSEFKRETFLHYDKIKSPALFFAMENACLNAGFIPKTMGMGPELLTIANLISSGIGVTLMPSDMIKLLPAEKIKAMNIKNENSYSSISVVWNNSPNLPPITESALQILKGQSKKLNIDV